MNDRSLLIIAISLWYVPAVACAQFQVLVSPPNKISVKDGRVMAGPDPNIPQHLYGLLLGHPSVAKELNVSPAQIDALKQLMETQQERFKEFAYGKKVDELREEVHDFHREQRFEFTNAMEEIVSPDQMARLRQLAYRYEVSAIGLATALAEGRLGADAGIFDQQRERILRRGEEIEARTQALIEAIRKKAEAELLAELAPEQRRNVNDLLGDFAFFSDLSKLKEQRKETLERLQSKSDE